MGKKELKDINNMPKPKGRPPTPYTIFLEVNERFYEEKGRTALDALMKLPEIIPKTKGVLTIKKGNNTHTRILFAQQVRRLCATEENKKIFAKLLESAV